MIWPYNGVYIMIDLEQFEIGQILQWLKNGTIQMVRQVNHSDFLILKLYL